MRSSFDTWIENQPFRSRARFDRALLVSLCLHAFLLMLQFGITGLGLPGLSSPLAENLSLTVRLAEVPAVVPKIAARKIRKARLPPAAPKEKTPEEREVTSIEPPEISAEVTPPAPPEEVTQEKTPTEPLESAPVVASPAPREEEPQERQITLSSPSESSFVMPPPAPREEEPKPREALAENAREVPKPEPAPVEEARTQEQAAPQQEAKREEEPARPEQASSEPQVAQQEAGRQAEEGEDEQAQAPAGQPDVQGGQPEGVSGEEQGRRLALELEVLRLPKFDETRPRQEEERKQEKKPEPPPPPPPPPPPAPVVRERKDTVVVEQPKETLQAPVEEARAKKIPGPQMPCDEAEGRFLMARELEHGGDLKGSFLAYKESAECGYGLAQRKLGDIYGTGNAVVFRDYEISLRWYRRARDQGIEIPNMARRLRSY